MINGSNINRIVSFLLYGFQGKFKFYGFGFVHVITCLIGTFLRIVTIDNGDKMLAANWRCSKKFAIFIIHAFTATIKIYNKNHFLQMPLELTLEILCIYGTLNNKSLNHHDVSKLVIHQTHFRPYNYSNL